MVGEEGLYIGGGLLTALAGVGKVLAVGISRSIAGWWENALEDSKVSTFEWGQLGATVIRTSVITGALYFGIEGIFGTDMTILAAGAGAFVTDFIVKKLSKKTLPTAPSKK